MIVVLALVLALLPFTPASVMAVPFAPIACPDGPGQPVLGQCCGYYDTNFGPKTWNGLGQRCQLFCKDETCSNLENGLTGLTTNVPPGSQVMVAVLYSPRSIDGDYDFHSRVCDTSMVLPAPHTFVNKWTRFARATQLDATDPYTHGARVEWWGTTVGQDADGNITGPGWSFPNPLVPWIPHSFYPPKIKEADFVPGDFVMFMTFEGYGGYEDPVNTGPRTMASPMVFPPDTFKKNPNGSFKVVATLSVGDPKPYTQDQIHDFGMIAIPGAAPVTIFAADGSLTNKNTVRTGPTGWQPGTDGGNNPGGIARTITTALTDMTVENVDNATTDVPVAFTVSKPAFWAGAVVALERNQ